MLKFLPKSNNSSSKARVGGSWLGLERFERQDSCDNADMYAQEEAGMSSSGPGRANSLPKSLAGVSPNDATTVDGTLHNSSDQHDPFQSSPRNLLGAFWLTSRCCVFYGGFSCCSLSDRHSAFPLRHSLTRRGWVSGSGKRLFSIL